MGEKDFTCPNCGSSQNYIGQPHEAKPDNKGRQYNLFSSDPHTNPMQFQKGTPLNRLSSQKKESAINDPEENNEADPEIVPYESNEFLQCIDPYSVTERKRRGNADDYIEEVTKSCLDLEIDG